MSWTVVNNMNYVKRVFSGDGAYDAGITVGGISGTTVRDYTESWNGTAWTVEDEIAFARYSMGVTGNDTDALCFGGIGSASAAHATTEKYASESWSTVNALNNYRKDTNGCGDADDSLCVCGTNSANIKLASTEIWDGTNWTVDADLDAARDQMSVMGDVNGAIAAGGRTSTTAIKDTEKFNGSTWSSGNDLNGYRRVCGEAGDDNNALIFGGINSAGANLATTEKYNGSTWSVAAVVSVAKHGPAGFGDISGAICAAGYTDADTQTTEKWLNSRLSGIVVDKVGTTITSVQCQIDVYDITSRDSYLGFATSSAGNGVWSTNSIYEYTNEKVLAMFTYEGVYKGDTDIAGAEFMTTTSAQ